MASFTFGRGHGFPSSTSVAAYEDLGQKADGQPNGLTATDTATVDAAGGLTFEGLSEGARYYAVAQVGSAWRWTSFRVDDPDSLPDSSAQVRGSDLVPLEARVEAVEAGGRTAINAEAPLNIRWPEFEAAKVGDDWGPAFDAVNDYIGDSFGAEVLIEGGAYALETNPTFTKDNVSLRGVGRPELTLDRIVVQADGFSAEGFDPVGAGGLGLARPFYIDSAGAGRPLKNFWFDDIRGLDTFYLIDFRGTEEFPIERVRWGNRIFSDYTLGGNAGHINFFYVHDAEGHGISATGGQNSASLNFGFCSGPVTVYGAHDKDNAPSGGGVNFENFIGDGLVSLIGGSLGWGLSGEDAFAVTFDDVNRFVMLGVVCGGYVRVTTSSAETTRGKISDCEMTRFFSGDQTGTPQFIDDLYLYDNLITGVPGVLLPDGISLDEFVRRARVVGNEIKRYQADGVTENWSNSAFKAVRSANLDLYLDDNDYGGRPVQATLSGGKVRWGPRNRNYGTLTGIPKRVSTVTSNADFTLTPFESSEHTIHTGGISTQRTVTLATTNAEEGMKFKLTRTGTGASALNFAGKGLLQNQWAEATFDGSAWVLTAFGSL